jgi:hypothetical protein
MTKKLNLEEGLKIARRVKNWHRPPHNYISSSRHLGIIGHVDESTVELSHKSFFVGQGDFCDDPDTGDNMERYIFDIIDKHKVSILRKEYIETYYTNKKAAALSGVKLRSSGPIKKLYYHASKKI